MARDNFASISRTGIDTAVGAGPPAIPTGVQLTNTSHNDDFKSSSEPAFAGSRRSIISSSTRFSAGSAAPVVHRDAATRLNRPVRCGTPRRPPRPPQRAGREAARALEERLRLLRLPRRRLYRSLRSSSPCRSHPVSRAVCWQLPYDRPPRRFATPARAQTYEAYLVRNRHAAPGEVEQRMLDQFEQRAFEVLVGPLFPIADRNREGEGTRRRARPRRSRRCAQVATWSARRDTPRCRRHESCGLSIGIGIASEDRGSWAAPRGRRFARKLANVKKPPNFGASTLLMSPNSPIPRAIVGRSRSERMSNNSRLSRKDRARKAILRISALVSRIARTRLDRSAGLPPKSWVDTITPVRPSVPTASPKPAPSAASDECSMST